MVLCGIQIMGAEKPMNYLKILMLRFFSTGISLTIRVEGTVEKVSREESEKYFHSRPRGSQLGAIVSKQTTVVAGRHVLYEAHKELEERYADGSVIPLPDFW